MLLLRPSPCLGRGIERNTANKETKQQQVCGFIAYPNVKLCEASTEWDFPFHEGRELQVKGSPRLLIYLFLCPWQRRRKIKSDQIQRWSKARVGSSLDVPLMIEWN